MSDSRPLLSIIIVSWNVRALLHTCLQSIEPRRTELNIEVIVVDSASGDDSVQMVAESFPWVKLLPQQENVGFARGNNIGMAAARGDYLLLLNPDTTIIGSALTTMLDYIRLHDDVGLVGPRLINADGSTQSSRRRFPTFLTALFESTWLEPYAPPAVLQRYRMSTLPEDRIVDVDWVTGACMLARREVVQQTLGLDEGYFMYSEELDWCRRIQQLGWRIVYLPAALVLHHHGKSSEQAQTQRHINFQRARLRYFRKFHGRTVYRLLRLFLLLSYAHQLLLEAVKGALGHRRSLRQQRVRAYLQVLRSGLPAAGY